MFQAEGGDFSENAGYQAVKGQLRGLNKKIEDLEDQIKFAVIIQSPKKDGTIQIGSQVEIKVDGKTRNYLILGSEELDLAKGIISYRSPLGASLMGRKVGEKFDVTLGEKEVVCEIVKIE
jgi:transcription elongation factor GreB